MRTMCCLLLVLGSSAGCLTFPKPAPKQAAPVVTAQKPRIPPVTAEQVNQTNAQAKLEALREELDRATREVTDKPVQEAHNETPARGASKGSD